MTNPETQERRCFDARDLRPVRGWLDTPPVGLRVEREEETRGRESYYDTEDWRFHRAGLALSVRDDRGVAFARTMPVSDAGLPAAEEPAEDSPAAVEGCTGAIGERVRALTGDTKLARLFELRSRRQVFRVTANGAAAVELVLDEVAIPLEGQDEPLKLNRVELAVPIDDPGVAWFEELQAAFGLQETPHSRHAAALLALGLAPPAAPELGSTAMTAEQTVGDRAFAVLRQQFAKVLAHDPGTRLGEDIEELHDMRVATRRMRAAIRLFEAYLPHRVLVLRKQLSWLGRALGEVRDLDVQLQQLDTWLHELDERDRPALDALARIYERQRVAARKRMLRALASRRYATLIRRLTGALRAGSVARSRLARTPILAAAPDLIGKRYRRVEKPGKAIDADSPEEAYHRLRIRCKALRYALEFHRGLYGPRADALIRRLVDLQDLLGDHQDAAVASASLRDVVAQHGKRLPPETVFVVGMLAERYARRAARLRRRFPRTFVRMRRRYKRVSRIMETARPVLPAPRSPRSVVPPDAGSGDQESA